MAGEEIKNSEYGFACRIQNIKEASKGNKVLSGGEVTVQSPTAMAVDYSAVEIKINKINYFFPSGSKTINASDSANDRYDLIYVNSSGVQYLAGTPSANPYPPNLPNDAVALAYIFVENNSTTVESSDIKDLRIIEQAISVPIKSIIAFARNLGQVDSGTTTSTSSYKLVDSSQNFTSTVEAGNFVYNTTDKTYATILSVDSDTELTLDKDIMVSGESYIIAVGEALPDNFVECNGQTLSDSESPLNGVTIPDLNGNTRLLIGNSSSGGTTTEDFLPNHSHGYWDQYRISSAGGGVGLTDQGRTTGSTTSGTPLVAYQIVWIMRVK